METLMEYDIDISDIQDDMFTKLMGEIRQSHIEIINLLIENGANVNMSNNSGITALTISVKSGQAEIVKHLIAQGADFDATLEWASEHNSFEQVQNILMENGAALN